MDARSTRSVLAHALTEIERHDQDYETRYGLVLIAMDYAARCGYQVGIALDPAEPAWPVVYIELPQGQVSWHMPAHPRPWDGHDTPAKYARCRAFTEAARP